MITGLLIPMLILAMSTTNIVLWIAAAVILVLYVSRRHSRKAKPTKM